MRFPVLCLSRHNMDGIKRKIVLRSNEKIKCGDIDICVDLKNFLMFIIFFLCDKHEELKILNKR